MKDFSLENIKQRTQKEKSMVDMTCSNIASLFNNSRNKNTNLKDEEKYIYREFEEGEISAKKMIAFLYKCFSPLDKFYYLLFLAVIVFLSVMAVLCTHIIVFPTLIQADSLLLLSAAILLLCVYIGKIIFDSLMEILTKRVCIKAEHSIQYAIMQRIISLSSECLNSFFSDDLGQILFFAGHSASEFMKGSLKSISLCVVSIVLLAQISYYAPGLLLPILSIVIVFLILSFSYVRVQKNISTKNQC